MDSGTGATLASELGKGRGPPSKESRRPMIAYPQAIFDAMAAPSASVRSFEGLLRLRLRKRVREGAKLGVSG